MLKSFHERIGLKTDAYEDSGWNDMLQSYFRPQIDRALSAVATNYNWAELYNNEAKKSSVPDRRGQGVHPAAAGRCRRRLLLRAVVHREQCVR